MIARKPEDYELLRFKQGYEAGLVAGADPRRGNPKRRHFNCAFIDGWTSGFWDTRGGAPPRLAIHWQSRKLAQQGRARGARATEAAFDQAWGRLNRASTSARPPRA